MACFVVMDSGLTPSACPGMTRRNAHVGRGTARRQARHLAEGRGLQLGRPARPRRPAHRRRAHGARQRQGLRAGETVPARAQGLSRGELRPRDHDRDGRARPARRDHPGRVRRRGARLCLLRADRARSRGGGLRLSLGDVGAVLAGDAPDLFLRQRGAAPPLSAEARDRRMGRLLRPDRAGLRLRSGRRW